MTSEEKEFIEAGDILKLENPIDVKVFILFLMNNVGEALNYDTVHDIVVQDEFVNHFDFAICFSELLEMGQVIEIGEEGKRRYFISQSGKETLESYESSLLTIIKERALRSALRLIAFNRSGNRILSSIEETEKGNMLRCSIVDKEKTIMSVEVFLTEKPYAERLKSNFDDRAEIIYRGILSLLSGDVNFIFEE